MIKVRKPPPRAFLFGLLTCAIVLLIAAAPFSATMPVRVDASVWQDTANGQTGDFLVVLKAQANARALARGAPDRDTEGRSVLEGLKQIADATQPAVKAQLDALGATYRSYWIVNVLAVKGKRSAVDSMAGRPDVAAIESNWPFHAVLDQPVRSSPQAPGTVEWNIDRVNAPALWAKGIIGQGRVYANADTGVQWDHPALQSHYRGWNGTAANHNYNWWDAIHTNLGGTPNFPCSLSSQVPCDDYGHGTHTMGIAVGDDGRGNLIGVAPGAKWIACRNMQGGVGQPSAYIECLQFFMAPTDLNGNNPDPTKRPDAVGNSYGCPPSEGCTDVDVLQKAVDNLRADGVFVAVSAGNSGPGCATIVDPPAIYDSAVTVGATDATDAIAPLSSRGPVTVDGSNRRKPDLAAPGVGVRSSYPMNTYMVWSGTSMASPHVAAAAVLLWSAFPKLVRNVDQTEIVLEAGALHETTSAGCGGDSSGLVPNNVYGYGRLDILAAYNIQGGFVHSLYLPFVATSP
ncbi:MAG: S8 family serine peptidase [Chloroflexi bacterium]|nr:S8 family serine peptidase [Chloroflexota bacterium]